VKHVLEDGTRHFSEFAVRLLFLKGDLQFKYVYILAMVHPATGELSFSLSDPDVPNTVVYVGAGIATTLLAAVATITLPDPFSAVTSTISVYPASFA
jgi:hypothetical protein